MTPRPTRRTFLAAMGATSIATAATPSAKRPAILLRSSWQTINIGDIGHTPGALSVIGRYFPDADVTLWPNRLTDDVREMLIKGYPRLKIAEGNLGRDDKPDTPELKKAWEEADLYLSGSGSGFPASAQAMAFQSATGKTVGVFGVSTDPISGVGEGREPEGGTLQQIRGKALSLPPSHIDTALRNIIDRSAFFFCRDSISRDYLKSQGVKTPILEFGPDAQLGMHLRNDAMGFTFLTRNRLEEGKFICVIPRLRYTPYSQIRGLPRVASDDIKDAINDRTVEKDHVKIRELIIAYVKKTGNRVLACPEMTYQVELAKRVLVDPLPEEVRKNVVWRDTFWLPDEAASVYSKARAVVSMECHSPLIALRNGTPSFYVRQPTDTCKGQMYRDIGAGDWFFEIDETDGEQLWSGLSEIESDPATAKRNARSIMAFVEARQRRMVEAVRAAYRV